MKNAAQGIEVTIKTIFTQTNLSLDSARLLKPFAISLPVVGCGCKSDFHLSFECTEELQSGL